MNNILKTGLVLGVALCTSIATVNAQNQTDKNGKKQGEWIKKDKNNRIVYKGQFKDDYPVDTFYYYDRNGKIELKNYYTDKGRKVYSQFIYPNGSVKAKGNYVDKNKEGLWEYYTEKGKKISEENYINNVKDGIEKKWETSGKDVIEATTYKHGVKQGEYFCSLYEEGYYKTFYNNNVLDGDYMEYYSDGTLKIKGRYEKGNKQGTWEVYDMQGTCVQKLFYKDDKFLGDAIRFNLQQGVKEIPQKDILLVRQAGKQTQIVLSNGDRYNVFNSIGGIVKLLSVNDFVRINEKSELYLNTSVIEGFNEDGSVKTKIDFGYKIIADKDAKGVIESMFRTDFEK